MDKKTNAKVINNMAEKIEALDDKIKRLDTSAYNNLVNLEIDINTRLEKLEKINLLNAERNTKYMEHFEKMADIMEMCEIADKRIDKVSEMADNINERCNVLTNFDEKILNCLEIIDERIHHLKSDIKELAKNDIELDDKINKVDSICVEHYDDLEAKNYILKSDIDKLIRDLDKLINGDKTITLGEFSKFKNWEEFNETMKEGHETLKRVKARKGENNE